MAVSVPEKTPADQLPDHTAKVELAGVEVEQELADMHALDEACPTEELQVDGGCADAMGASSGSSSGSIANARSCAEEERAEINAQGRRRKRWSAAARCVSASAWQKRGLTHVHLVVCSFLKH